MKKSLKANGLKIALIGLICLLAGTGMAQNADWSSFSNAKGQVKMRFPSTPEISDKWTNTGHHYTVASTSEGTQYILRFTIYNEEFMKKVRLGNNGIERYAEETGATILTHKDMKIVKQAARSAMMENTDKGQNIQYRSFLKSGIFYEQIVLVPMDKKNPKKTIKKFHKSFELME